MNDKPVVVKLETINAVLQYLGKQPYEEVAQFIGVLHSEVQPQLQDSVEESDSTEE